MAKRILLIVAIWSISACSVNAADASARAVQRQVWGQYLDNKENEALAAMIPENGIENDATSSDPTVDNLTVSRKAFQAMAEKYALSLADIPSVSYEKGGVKGSWLTPADSHPSRTILYLHGGAFVIGSDATPRAITALLACEAKMRCFSLDYPLAPEHPFPAAVDNAMQAYRLLLEEGLSPGELVVAGDSAGGGLVLSLLLGIREGKLPMPAGAYLISPWADLTQTSETHGRKSAVDMNITADFLEKSASLYAVGHDRSNPLISPVHGDLRGFPPLLIQVGSHERLLDDSLTIARNAALADVPVILSVWPGYPHVFHFYHRDLAGARKALRDAGYFLNAVIEGKFLR